MPIFEVERNGQTFEIDAPNMDAAIKALDGYQPSAPPARPRLTDAFASAYSGMYGAGTPESLQAQTDVARGVAKGGANTAIGLGELVHRVPGVSRTIDAAYGRPVSQQSFREARAAVQPRNSDEAVGFYGEQVLENLLPTGAVSRGVRFAAEVGKSGLLTAAQGGSARDTGIAAVSSAVIPGGGAVRRTGQAIADQAVPLVRAAIKPTVASLRRITGQGGMDAKANALVRFIIDNRLTTADKARTLFTETEHELQRVLSVRNAPTDAATRASRYLQALERSAARQGLGASDVAQINNAAAELLQGPMGRDVVTMVPTPSQILGPNGQPLMVLRPQTTRQLHTQVPATEALDSARSSSRWSTRRAWGEQRGATTEAAKSVERAQRDAVKAAVPEAAPLLRTEGQALKAEEVLDRMAQRTGNRESVSLPATVMAAGGREVLAFASNWLRNNQMRAGMWADALGKAIQAGNAPLAADILKRLSVGTISQAVRTPATAQ